MPYPFHVLENEKIPVPAQDLETFIRHSLGKHWFIVERENLDDTKRRFTLYFWQRHIGLDRYMEDGKIGKVYWGGAEIIEWSDSTEIARMWAATPEDWYIGEFNLDINKEMEERFGWLEELSDEIRERFGVLSSELKNDSDEKPAGRHKTKGGRPRNADDDWAFEQVRTLGRDKQEVYAEWLGKIGDRKALLSDPKDSFNKAISLKRSKRK